MSDNERSVWKIDLLSLGPLKRLRKGWSMPTLANLRARSEALGILYEELAVATERGVPLDRALEMAGEPARSLPEWEGSQRPFSIVLFVAGIMALCFGLFALPLVVVGYLIMGPRLVDASAIARRLGKKLHRHVANGLPLSDAMTRCGTDFETPEIEVVRMAEDAGMLAAGLRRLARYQTTEHRLLTQTGSLVYPIMLLVFLLSVGAFMLAKVVPKFVDTFQQIGAELPPLTLALVGLSDSILLALALPVLAGILFLHVWYGLMNGGTVGRVLAIAFGWLASVGVFTGAALVAGWQVVLWTSMGGGPAEVWIMAFSGACGILFSIIAAPAFLASAERVLLSVHRGVRSLLVRVPVLGAGARAERDARWLMALSLALDTGRTAPEAIDAAGRVSGGGLAALSAKASGLVAAGHGIGDACARLGLPGRRAAAMIAWKDASPDFLPSLREIAADSSARATETLARASQIAEVVAQILIGFVVGVFVLAMYLPLFGIPQIVALQ